jgi:hypothetical protein
MAKYLINTYLNEKRKEPIVSVHSVAVVPLKEPLNGIYDCKYAASGPDDFAYMVSGIQVFDTEEEAEDALKRPESFWDQIRQREKTVRYNTDQRNWIIADLVKHGQNVRTDFEGLASSRGIKGRADKIVKSFDHEPEEIQEALRDILCHYIYESRDQADYRPSDRILYEIAGVVAQILTTGRWLKVEAE